MSPVMLGMLVVGGVVVAFGALRVVRVVGRFAALMRGEVEVGPPDEDDAPSQPPTPLPALPPRSVELLDRIRAPARDNARAQAVAALRELLAAHGVAVDASAAIDASVTSIDEWLAALIPTRTVTASTEPFGAFTDKEERDYYPDIIRGLAKATQGDWPVPKVDVELQEEAFVVRFEAFGKAHKLECERGGSSYADIEPVEEALSEIVPKLPGRYVTSENNTTARWFYVPSDLAPHLQQLF